jgi:hypothetical protein
MQEEAPPPANEPHFAEEVPEAPFMEAEEEDFGPAPVLHLTGAARRDPAPPTEELPLLARMAAWEEADAALADADAEAEAAAEAEEDAFSLAELVGDMEGESAEDLAELAALDGVSPEEAGLSEVDSSAVEDVAQAPEPAPAAPGLAELARRLRALPRPVSPETAAALAPVLQQARALQARLSAGRG